MRVVERDWSRRKERKYTVDGQKKRGKESAVINSGKTLQVGRVFLAPLGMLQNLPASSSIFLLNVPGIAFSLS